MKDKYIDEERDDSMMAHDDSTISYGSADAIRIQGINVLWSTQDTSILLELVDCLRQKMQELNDARKQEARSQARNKTLKAIADARRGKNITQCNSFEEYLKAVAE